MALKRYYNKTQVEAGCDEAGRGCLAGPVFAKIAKKIVPESFTKTGSIASLGEQKTFNPNEFTSLIAKFIDSPETFYQRLTNVLSKDFNLKNLFFLRFNYKPSRSDFQLTKELHITNLLEPHANENNEHYCRRWVSL